MTYKSKNSFKNDDSKCEIVDSHSVILPAHDFRSHIARSSTCIFFIIGVPNSCDSKVCNSQISLTIKYNVFRFDVSMNNAVVVQVFKALNNTGSKEFGLEFIKSSVLSNVVSEISSSKIIHD